ncbi:MAG: N-ethylammeline chlorohydrolase [Alkaliphilus sp.]|nr:amidohydrolase [bacterium AH-315-G05]PHS36269.1 MAG: N-ethylammeline chlorohydrolase [Alkaliphilus sp.]
MKILIKNTTLLTMNKSNELVKYCDIAIENDSIKHIGDIPNDFVPDTVINGENKLTMPGLINSHTHIAMSLFRNYADDLPFWPWLTEKIWPLEEKLTSDSVYWGSMLSIVELIQSGVTCFSDMYFFMDDVAKAVEEVGIRAVLSRGVADINGDGEAKLVETKDFYNRWISKADGRITIMVAPHAPYTCSPDYIKKTIALAKELNIGIHIHLSETLKEVEDSYKEHDKSPIKHVSDLGLFDVNTTAAHCVHLSDEDIEILSTKGVNVINNPGSNLKLGNGFAQVDKLISKGVNVALGTDGSASNNNLNMFEEINLAAIVNKAVNLDSTSVPAIKAIEMATKNGAKALNLNSIGSIEIGKKADVILIDMKKPHYYPRHNEVSALAYSAQASDVETVIINGKIIMDNYKIKTVDLEKIYYNIDRVTKDLLKD